jgi:hypothetical protein
MKGAPNKLTEKELLEFAKSFEIMRCVLPKS